MRLVSFQDCARLAFGLRPTGWLRGYSRKKVTFHAASIIGRCVGEEGVLFVLKDHQINLPTRPAAVNRIMTSSLTKMLCWQSHEVDQVNADVQQGVVCDARRNHLISQDRHKHDRRDAFASARLLRLDKFKAVWQPVEDQRVLRRQNRHNSLFNLQLGQ